MAVGLAMPAGAAPWRDEPAVGAADEAKREQLGRASPQALGLCFPLRPRVETSQQQRQHHHYPDWDLLDPSSWSR